MENNHFENKIPAQEQLDIKFRIATTDEWQKCKELRLTSISGSESNMMCLTPEKTKEETNKTEKEWRKETNSDTMFSVLAYSNLVAIGLGRTKEIKKGVWLVRNAYVKPEFRNMGIQQKILALRLNEIIKREGTKALTVVRTDNPISKHNIEKFGFKKISLINQVIKIGRSALKENIFELDLKDKEVIKKIEEILNKK